MQPRASSNYLARVLEHATFKHQKHIEILRFMIRSIYTTGGAGVSMSIYFKQRQAGFSVRSLVNISSIIILLQLVDACIIIVLQLVDACIIIVLQLVDAYIVDLKCSCVQSSLFWACFYRTVCLLLLQNLATFAGFPND